MSAGGKSVVQFLRGIDLTGVNMNSPASSSSSTDNESSMSWSLELTRVQWLKLRDTGLTAVPSDLAHLERLEHLTLSKNELTRVNEELARLKSLRVLNLRKNKISSGGVPAVLFDNQELQVIDLSHNFLMDVPRGLECAKGLLVLNMSHNSINSVPSEVFVNCTDLMFLDLSDNKIESLPAQLRRLTSLQTLCLNNNPLRHAQLRSLSSLKQLTTLHLASTERRLDTFPTDLDKLTELTDLDLSDNALPRIPQAIFQLRSLRKLNLSGNEITDLSGLVDCWPQLEYLNLSHNRLTSLPAALCRLSALRKLYLNSNELAFNGIPSGIGKLNELEVFTAADNKLENIPEGLCRCGRLKRLILNSNELVTLPDAIHYLIENLEVFEVSYNPNLKFPPKPAELQTGAGLAYYNIDFSLATQMRLARGKPAEPVEQPRQPRDTASRLRRLRKQRRGEDGEGSNRVLEGMKRVAKEKEELLKGRDEEEAKHVAARRWQDALAKPDLDYSKIFEEDVGSVPGLEVWEMDEFYPKRLEEEGLLGTFYDGDCYIILETIIDSTSSLDWAIYYWIGGKASLDKKACAAMHAVNLRNFLGAECRTQREEQGDESVEFQAVFISYGINVVEGAHAESGFLRAEDREPKPKLYRLYGDKQIRMVSMAVCPESLDPKYVYLLDAHMKLFVWLGYKSRLMPQSKGRLIADNINLRERKGNAEIIVLCQRAESPEFWTILRRAAANAADLAEDDDDAFSGSDRSSRRQSLEISRESSKEPEATTPTSKPWHYRPEDHIPMEWLPARPVVYDVKLGRGYLEMPQVELPMNRLTRTVLSPKKVLIVDCGGEVFLWIGEKSARFLRSAGWRLALELVQLLPRDRRSAPIPCTQGSEPQIFKAQFEGWDDSIAVDFTRTAESVQRRGANLMEILKKDQIKVELRALFMPRERAIPWEEACTMMEDWNEELIGGGGGGGADDDPPRPKYRLKQFIMMGKKWTPVEQRWIGHFFNQDSYVVIAEYWDYTEEEDEERDEEDEDEEEEPTKAIVYFWQGREASSMDYLTFNFSLRKGMEDRLAEARGGKRRPVEVKHMIQQKEDLLFLAHMQSRCMIHTGRYRDREGVERRRRVEMFQLRTNGSALSTRCVEVKANSLQLNSCFCYIVKVPGLVLGNPDGPGRVYIWLGEKASTHEVEIINELSQETFAPDGHELITVKEGEEDKVFWAVLGGQKRYDQTCDYLQYSRLFRLSNEQGFFSVSEKCADFCQDDLADEDVMLLDTGEQIYLWIGKRTSDVEVKLSVQAAKLYKEHLALIQQHQPRQLKLTTKRGEPHMFRRCFHGWGPFKEAKDWAG